MMMMMMILLLLRETMMLLLLYDCYYYHVSCDTHLHFFSFVTVGVNTENNNKFVTGTRAEYKIQLNGTRRR
jgi:hypothetical protein